MELVDDYDFNKNIRFRLYENISELGKTINEFRELLAGESKENIYKLMDKMWNDLTAYTYLTNQAKDIESKLFYVAYAFERFFVFFRYDFVKRKNYNPDIYEVLKNLSSFYELFFIKKQTDSFSERAKKRWLYVNRQIIKELKSSTKINEAEKVDRINQIKSLINSHVKNFNINLKEFEPLFLINVEEILLELQSEINDNNIKDLIAWYLEEKLPNRKRIVLKQIIWELNSFDYEKFKEYINKLNDALKKF